MSVRYNEMGVEIRLLKRDWDKGTWELVVKGVTCCSPIRANIPIDPELAWLFDTNCWPNESQQMEPLFDSILGLTEGLHVISNSTKDV